MCISLPFVRPAAAALGLLCAAPGHAAGERTTVAPVVVEATRLPSPAAESAWPVSVVQGERLTRARAGLAFDEALAAVPGLYAQNRYNFAQDLRLSIRGFGARSTFGIRGLTLLVDGVPATLPDGQAGVDAIDPLDLERIEIIRGPAASLYGAAAGGVLSLVSRPPPREPTAGAAVRFARHGHAEQRVHAGGTSGDASGRVSASHLRVDGSRANSAAERTLLTARGRLALAGGGAVDASLSAVHSPRAQDPGGLTAAERAADRRQASPLNQRFRTGETVTQQRLGVRLRQPLAGGQVIARAWGLARDFDSRLPFQAVALDRAAFGAGLEFTRHVALLGSPLEVLAGLDLGAQDDDRARFVNADGAVGARLADQRERVTSAGAFGHARWRAHPDLLLSAGLRADRVRIQVSDRFAADGDQSGTLDFAALSPSAGAVLTVSPSLDLYANAATAFETPTTTELADPGGAGGFNTALDAQRALSLETGLRGWLADGALRYELALFHVRVEDQLVAFPIPGAPGRFAFQNAGRSRHAGVEVSAEADMGDDVTVRAAWTLSAFTFRRFTDRAGAVLDGRRLPGIPRHLLALEAEWRPARGWFLAGDVQAVSARLADSAGTAHAAGYLLVNARAGYEWRRGPLTLAAHAGVDNLLATRFDANVRIDAAGGRFFEPAPGRGAHAGMSVSVRF